MDIRLAVVMLLVTQSVHVTEMNSLSNAFRFENRNHSFALSLTWSTRLDKFDCGYGTVSLIVETFFEFDWFKPLSHPKLSIINMVRLRLASTGLFFNDWFGRDTNLVSLLANIFCDEFCRTELLWNSDLTPHPILFYIFQKIRKEPCVDTVKKRETRENDAHRRFILWNNGNVGTFINNNGEEKTNKTTCPRFETIVNEESVSYRWKGGGRCRRSDSPAQQKVFYTLARCASRETAW